MTLRCNLALGLLLAAGLADAGMRKGPYLIYPGTNTQMWVLWQLDTSTVCALEWGTDTNYSAGSMVSHEYNPGSWGHQHWCVITGLVPGVRYQYCVTDETSGYTGAFRAALPTDARNVEFFVYGDNNPNNYNRHGGVADAMTRVYTTNPDAQTIVLQTGDRCGFGLNENYWQNEYFNRSYTNLMTLLRTMPMQACYGAHDDSGSSTDSNNVPRLNCFYWPYPYLSTSRYYWSFDYGPAHIVVLDYLGGLGAGAQHVWFTNDLARAQQPWKIVLWHSAAYNAGGTHAASSTAQRYLQQLCAQYGVPIIFSGHDHYYSRCERQGVMHIVTGAAGSSLYQPDIATPYVLIATSNYHYCQVAISSNDMRVTAVLTNGTVIEILRMTKELSPPRILAPVAVGASASGFYVAPDRAMTIAGEKASNTWVVRVAQAPGGFTTNDIAQTYDGATWQFQAFVAPGTNAWFCNVSTNWFAFKSADAGLQRVSVLTTTLEVELPEPGEIMLHCISVCLGLAGRCRLGHVRLRQHYCNPKQ